MIELNEIIHIDLNRIGGNPKYEGIPTMSRMTDDDTFKSFDSMVSSTVEYGDFPYRSNRIGLEYNVGTF